MGHYDLISWFSDFAIYLSTQVVYFFHTMFAYDKTYIISRFGDFPLYLCAHLVYEHTSAYDKTFDRKVFLGHCDLISWFSDFAVYLDIQLVFFHTSI